MSAFLTWNYHLVEQNLPFYLGAAYRHSQKDFSSGEAWPPWRKLRRFFPSFYGKKNVPNLFPAAPGQVSDNLRRARPLKPPDSYWVALSVPGAHVSLSTNQQSHKEIRCDAHRSGCRSFSCFGASSEKVSGRPRPCVTARAATSRR